MYELGPFGHEDRMEVSGATFRNSIVGWKLLTFEMDFSAPWCPDYLGEAYMAIWIVWKPSTVLFLGEANYLRPVQLNAIYARLVKGWSIGFDW